ncbi:MAG: tetratricopeptide repeat protein, partial [Flavobacteriales bacterium]|nr:tetratricopeptide repeat protein [Flavobacteriales bacterium]
MKTLLTILFLLPLLVSAQLTFEQEGIIDSLKQTIARATHDSITVKSWIAWDNIIYKSDLKLDLELNTQIEALCSTKLNSDHLTDHEKEFFLNSQASALNVLGIYSKNRGENVLAIDFYERSMRIRKTLGDQNGVATTLNNIGNIYMNKGDYVNAIDYFTRSLLIKEELQDDRGIANSLTSIGNIHYVQLDFKLAQDLYTRTLSIYEKMENRSGIAIAYTNIGNIHYVQQEFALAEGYYNKSLVIHNELGNRQGMAFCQSSLGNILYEQKNYNSAIAYHTRSLKIRGENGERKYVSASLNYIGLNHQGLGNYRKAIDFGTRALKLARELETPIEKASAANLLYEAYKAMGNDKAALEMYELYVVTQDSLDSEENQKEVIRQEYKYQYDKQSLADSLDFAQQHELHELAHKSEIDKQSAVDGARQDRQNIIIGSVSSGLALVILFSIFLFNRFRVIGKQKGVIEEQKQEVDLAYDSLEEKNKEITDSIHYAKRIQSAILPPTKLVKEYLKQSFILYKPKDIV